MWEGWSLGGNGNLLHKNWVRIILTIDPSFYKITFASGNLAEVTWEGVSTSTMKVLEWRKTNE